MWPTVLGTQIADEGRGRKNRMPTPAGAVLGRPTDVTSGSFARWGGGHSVLVIRDSVDVQGVWCEAGPLTPPFLIFSVFVLTRLDEHLVQCKLWIAAELVIQARVKQTYNKSVPNQPVVDFPRGIVAFLHEISERREKRVD